MPLPMSVNEADRLAVLALYRVPRHATGFRSRCVDRACGSDLQ